MFELLLPLTAITSFYVTYQLNNKMIPAEGNKGLFLKLGATWFTCFNIKQAAQESYQVVKEKETFGSAANFVTSVTVATVASNYMMYKNIKFSGLEAATTYSDIFKGTGLFIIGLSVAPGVTKYITNMANNAFFNPNESFEEYVNSGKLKTITMLAGSTVIGAAATQIVTSVTKIESSAVKVALTAALTLPTFIRLANVDFKAICNEEKCTILGMITSNDE